MVAGTQAAVGQGPGDRGDVTAVDDHGDLSTVTDVLLVPTMIQMLVDAPEAAAAEPLKVAFVYIGPVGDAGWTFAHDNGRKAVEANARKLKVGNDKVDKDDVLAGLTAR